MIVKDLIEELKRCEPNAKARIKITVQVTHESGAIMMATKIINPDRVITHSATIETVE